MKKRMTAFAMALAMVLGVTAMAAGAEKTISITPMTMTINGLAVTPLKSDGTPAEVFAYDGATYVPLRYLSELLGITVEWDKNDPDTAKLVGENVKAPAAAGGYTPGTYTATEFGMMGDVTVTMTFAADKITDVKAVGEKETPGIGTNALEQLPGAILNAQSAAVDAVSGATVTSAAIKTAAGKCIAQAKGGAQSAGETTRETTADVIIIGGGAAGLSAAITAAESGASVIVLEANGRTGGSAALSGGNLNSIDDATLEKLGRNDKDVEVYLDYTAADFPAEYADDLKKVQADVKAYLADKSITKAYDSVERIMLDHWNKGQGNGKDKDMDGKLAVLDYPYIRKAVEQNGAIYSWLVDCGLTFQKPSNKHFVTPGNKGAELTEVLLATAEKKGAQVHLNTRGVELTTDNSGKVGGVVAEVNGEKVNYTANKGVVIATGSFSANYEMVKKYQNVVSDIGGRIYSSNPETNIGDGIVMAEKLGARLYDMGYIGWMFRGYALGASTAEATTMGNAKQLSVNNNGVRYCEDSGSNLAFATLPQPDATANLVGDKAMYDAMEKATPGLVATLEERGILFRGNTIEEAAEKAGIDAKTLAATIEKFNKAVDAGKDEEFGRTKFNGKVLEAPFVIAKAQPVAHLTYGGLASDLEARVLKDDGSAIPGLYAAGDVVAGFEGYNHQTGECLTTVMFYGRVAGANAAKQ